jgi:SDR family mycofactocin-dependent oxidoreductase
MSAVDGRFADRVVFITGAARGQGRNHALRFAAEGADIVACDVPARMASVPYPLSTAEDLAETVSLVEALGRRCLGLPVDIRDGAAMAAAVETTMAEFGHLDIALANAGVVNLQAITDIDDQSWHDVIDTNLTGTFNTLRAVIPPMTAAGFGRIVVTSSMSGRRGNPGAAHYSASKWGVIGLVKSVALELRHTGITVNAVCTTNVDTPMIHNPFVYQRYCPDIDSPTVDDVLAGFTAVNQIPVPWVEPDDVSHMILFLAGTEARYVTGSTLDVSCGWTALMP